MPKSLDEIFGNYEARKLAEKTAAEEKAEKERKEREATGVLISSVVLPALKELVVQVVAKGHKAQLHERIETHAYPHLVLEFTPVPNVKPSHGNSYIPSSKVTFMHCEGGSVKVTKEIQSNSNSSLSRGYGSGGEYTAKPEQVTAEWAMNQAVMFIESVLSAN